MESNFSDKHLRDKLSSIDPPYDPHAWAQMEAMLGEKKRRGFLWWWFGGIAAALLLGVGVWQFLGHSSQLTVNGSMQTMDHGPRTMENTINTQTSGLVSHTTVNTNNSLVSSNTETSQPNNTIGLTTQPQTTNISNKKTSAPHNNKTTKQNVTATELVEPVAANNNFKGYKTNNMASGSNNNKAAAASRRNKHAASPVANSSRAIAASGNSVKTTNSKNEILTSAKEETAVSTNRSATLEASVIEAEKMFPDKLGLIAETDKIVSLTEDGPPALRKLKPRVFAYSLGVIANVTGSTLGPQEYTPFKNRQAPLFDNRPSFAVGLTQDLTFFNRFAVTTGIAYAQTSFGLYSAKTVSFAIAPLQYTSQLKEFQIPIGIKVYPVFKKHIRFYLQAGIINHITLSETFTYTIPDSAIPNLSSSTFADVPTKTVYSPDAFTPSFSVSSGGVQSTNNSTADFSMSKGKRYYASFYASAGVEYVAQKHFILFTEPLFYMSLQKIGVQEKRKYNLGLSGGFRYQF